MTINFSKLDNAELKLSFFRNIFNENDEDSPQKYPNNKIVKIFGINYNILRIESGMAGLTFIN